ncbi:MAG: 23S rRNA (uracil(1939)-C(5))-methyltransferase RlmD, partial [Eubacteriales bacterium]|nr:23S rRNA (uracil(1939)-C(5))-methyltransferase RlmD [Eubacteriales bacterium]
MEIKKNDFFNIEIVDIGINGEGIGKIDNFTVFVENALPKEIVKIKILKTKKNYGYGKLIEILNPSPSRTQPPCKYYNKCGGCNLQHISYEEQLNIKTKKVKDNIQRIGGFNSFNINKALGMENPFNYRNKASFPVNFENQINIGFYSPRSHNIVNIENCLINHPVNENILKAFKKFLITSNVSIYNEKTGKGLIKHLITRVSNKTKEILICVVVNSTSFNQKEKLIKAYENIPKLDSIIINLTLIHIYEPTRP